MNKNKEEKKMKAKNYVPHGIFNSLSEQLYFKRFWREHPRVVLGHKC